MKVRLVKTPPGTPSGHPGKQQENMGSVVLTKNPQGGTKQPPTGFVPHTKKVPVDSPLTNDDGNHDGTGYPGESH